MRYLILGLGIYGSNLARDLTNMGHEVIGVDKCQANIDAIKDYISTVYMIDVTEQASLTLLPLDNVDLVIVAIGENFGASIKVVAMLKKLNIKHIFARAIDRLHESILQGFEIDRILTPEQRAARDLTFEMGLGSNVQSLAVDDEHYVLKFKVPDSLVGLKYTDINFDKNYHITLISVARLKPKRNMIGISHPALDVIALETAGQIEAGDEITCLGTRRDYVTFFRILNS